MTMQDNQLTNSFNSIMSAFAVKMANGGMCGPTQEYLVVRGRLVGSDKATPWFAVYNGYHKKQGIDGANPGDIVALKKPEGSSTFKPCDNMSAKVGDFITGFSNGKIDHAELVAEFAVTYSFYVNCIYPFDLLPEHEAAAPLAMPGFDVEKFVKTAGYWRNFEIDLAYNSLAVRIGRKMGQETAAALGLNLRI